MSQNAVPGRAGMLRQHRALIAGGSNLGDRLKNLDRAAGQFGSCGCMLLKTSSIYATEPWGSSDQDEYFNIAWMVETSLSPPELLACLLGIEERMGRKRSVKWAPRLIDLDILLYDDIVLKKENLVVPHPHFHERKFALVPAAEIAPGWIHPVLGKKIAELLQETNDRLAVRKLDMA